MHSNDKFELSIDDNFENPLDEDTAHKISELQAEFIRNLSQKPESMPVSDWLEGELSKKLPEHSAEEIKSYAQDITKTIEQQEQNIKEIRECKSKGRSTEFWVTKQLNKATANMSTQEAAKYLQNLDDALTEANVNLGRTIETKLGVPNQNPNLDGYIAEQYHAQTFNMNAEANGSRYRARVKTPDGKPYSKNGVDLEIYDTKTGKTVSRYQSKYCKDAQATENAFNEGDYRGQRKLVPEEQAEALRKKGLKVNDTIEAPDGTKSNKLPKSRAQQMRDEAQKGNFQDLNWDEYKMKDVAIGIGRQAGYASLQSAALGVGFDVAEKILTGKKIEVDKLAEKAVKTGIDTGVKSATAGAVKVAVEKGWITKIPKGTPAANIALMCNVGIEQTKILSQLANGEITATEALDKTTENAASTIIGTTMSAKGASIGAACGTIFGPIGTAIGGFVGGTLGFLAGSTIGKGVAKAANTVRKVATSAVTGFAKAVGKTVSEAASCIGSGLKAVGSFVSSAISSVGSFFSSLL